jgi:hypothetical protein
MKLQRSMELQSNVSDTVSTSITKLPDPCKTDTHDSSVQKFQDIANSGICI